MEDEPNEKEPDDILMKIGRTILDHEMALQDEFERHEAWLFNHGLISELQYNEAVMEYRKRFNGKDERDS